MTISIIELNTLKQTVRLSMSINDVYDVINGLNIMCANKEEEIARYGGGEIEKNQLKRYEECRDGMQKVKAALLGN